MLALCKKRKIFIKPAKALCLDADKQVLAFKRGGLILLFNFSPTHSYEGYCLKVPTKGVYKVADQYKQAGMKDVTVSLFEGMRHEIINERNKQQVYDVVTRWMNNEKI